MLRIGIDVGGTFTDAVVINHQEIVAFAKRRTTHHNLLEGLLAALDAVLVSVDREAVSLISLSTTVITNQVVEHKLSNTDLYIVPGPGASVAGVFPVPPIILKGAVDHQGRERAPFLLHKRNKKGTAAAVSVKFGTRNPAVEAKLTKDVKDLGYDVVSSGITLGGILNFPRRTVSAYYNSAVQAGFTKFIEEVTAACKERMLHCPIYMLKADGGALPMEAIRKTPVESIFTGPAASVRGMERLSVMPKGKVVAVDIGGTTADISLWKEGAPCMARGGVSIDGYPSSVRSFQVTSVGIGGDSWVRYSESGEILVGPERKGPAMALGGEVPTLGDALIVLKQASYGDVERSLVGIQSLLHEGETIESIAEAIVAKAVDVIRGGIRRAIEEENRLPIYVVEDIMHPDSFTMEGLVLVGGTAAAMESALEKAFSVPTNVPLRAEVANAIGAAAAPESISLTFHLDTRKRSLLVPELGYEEKITMRSYTELEERGKEILLERVANLGVKEEGILEVYTKEIFPVIEGWGQVHQVMDLVLEWKGGGIYVQG